MKVFILPASLSTETEDNLVIDDTISFKVFKYTLDSATIDDSISTVVIFRRLMESFISIDDVITLTLLRTVDEDSATITDSISIKPNYGMFDGLIGFDGQLVQKRTFQEVDPPDHVQISEFIAKKFVTFVREESAVLADNLSFKVTYALFDELVSDDGQLVVKRTFLDVDPDSAIFSDFILKKLVQVLREEPVFIDDFITTKAVNTRFIFDSVTVHEIAMAKAKYPMEDSATIRDSITRNSTFRREFEDSATIDDSISKFAGLSTFDTVNIDDLVSIMPKLSFADSATIDDSIEKLIKSRVEDSITIEDLLDRRYDARRTTFDSATIDDIVSASAKFRRLLEDSSDIQDVNFKAPNVQYTRLCKLHMMQ